MDEYSNFLVNTQNAQICFVNDGSTDNTLNILQEVQQKFPEKVHVMSMAQNSGKAEAVRAGINYANQHFQHQYIGYLDADLAATLEEFVELEGFMTDKIVFCFGSRIQKIGSRIDRDFKRFLIGRIIATFISSGLELKVYDTQCGCKLFSKEISEKLFQESFISKWLFDVELFFRMIQLFGREKVLDKMFEVPLKVWVEKGNSKVKLTYFFKLWFDLYTIVKKYKKSNSKI